MFRKLALSGLLAATVLASAAPSFAKVNEYEGQHRNAAQTSEMSRKVNEYEGQHRFAIMTNIVTRKVNEYEGQH